MHSNTVTIDSPCHESWEAMQGDAARRFCGVCQKHVHNLSAMAHDEAQALLAAKAKEHLCVRYSSEADGTLRFRDLVPRASLTRKIVRTAFAAAALAACTPHGEAPLQGLGEAIIETVRESTVASVDGGCIYTTGPFTSFHLPAGHALCRMSGEGETIAEPVVEEGRVPVIEAQPEREVQGLVMAAPEPKPTLVPCDPAAKDEPATKQPDDPPRRRPMMGGKRPARDVAEKMGKMQLPVDEL
ncbi:hypothetical protein [Nannocystis sp.]|uniref:hypothetical protein n=1 Tax=Nannocystis sp. TaxID=1962667 RepID=UPI002424952F|nr:hypothetical protein [Nannocystis sp.]MBK7826687.1 hypothetical protein [Nannocystis sp.]MBK9754306.1 hypothetical protein [Nannocystis sp.]